MAANLKLFDFALGEEQMAELDAQRAALQDKLTALEAQCGAAEGEVEKLRLQKADVDARAAAVEAEKVQQVPRLQYSMSLFANISKIKWDFAAFDQGGRVKGTLSVPGSDAVKAFDMDPRVTSDYDIANNLWAMLDE